MLLSLVKFSNKIKRIDKIIIIIIQLLTLSTDTPLLYQQEKLPALVVFVLQSKCFSNRENLIINFRPRYSRKYAQRKYVFLPEFFFIFDKDFFKKTIFV